MSGRLFKNRIAMGFGLGRHSDLYVSLLLENEPWFIGDIIDVGIEILPMKELQSQMSSGVGYYDCRLYDLIRQGRSSPAVPMVVIGIAT